MNRRQFLQCSAALGLAALLPHSSQAAVPTTTTGHAINKFGRSLLKTLPTDKNIFMSPFSLATALAMAGAGSAGRTSPEFLKLLGFANTTEMTASFSALLPQLASSQEYELATANGLFVDDTFRLLRPYQTSMEKKFRARVEEVDFNGDPTGSIKTVNDWVADATHQKIKKMMKPNPALRCVLANAIYFKGDWKDAFKEEATKPARFHLKRGGSVEVPMMHAPARRLAYGKSEGLEAVRLPYKGEDLVMNVILPEENKEIDTIDPTLSTTQFGSQKVQVSMPKYQLETSYELVKPLQALGLRLAFSDLADFSRISKEPLKIDTVSHKAFLEVDEKGTEAAAATTIGMIQRTSVHRPPIQFRVDRPFLLTIEHLPSKTLLFVGRVLNPVK